MRFCVLVLAVCVLFSSCDISSLYDYVPGVITPERDERVKYVLQSGDSASYFGYELTEIEYKEPSLYIAGTAYDVSSGELFTMAGDADVHISRACITISFDSLEPLVFVSV